MEAKVDSKFIKQAIIQSLRCLKDEREPLEIKEVTERVIASRLIIHLSKIIESQFEDVFVDCEYAVGFFEKKKCLEADLELQKLAKKLRRKIRKNSHWTYVKVIPDIVIHKRGPDGPNYAVIELKIDSKKDSDEYKYASMKIERFLGLPFQYKVGALVNIPRCWKKIESDENVKLFINEKCTSPN